MRTIFKKWILLILIFSTLPVFAEIKPLYQLPEDLPAKKSTEKKGAFLLGCNEGLYRVNSKTTLEPLWTEGKVERILRTSEKWYFITSKGILSSADLESFKECNEGLPFLTVKTYENKTKNLVKQVALLKDIAVDPFNPKVLVTATKDAVYLTRDGGETWKSLGSASKYTSGVKAVACSTMPVYDKRGKVTGNELVVFMSHPIYGFSYYRADAKNPIWVDISAGFSAMPSMTQVDEIADIIPVVCKDEEGNLYPEIIASQSYIPNIFKFNWKTKRAEKIYTGKEKCDTIESLCQSNSNIVFLSPGKVSSYSLTDGSVSEVDINKTWYSKVCRSDLTVNSVYIPKNESGLKTSLELSEIYLLDPERIRTTYGEIANKKKAVYSSVYQLRNQTGISKYRKITKDNKLNAIVIDMKDDYGLLRFTPKSELLKKKGTVTQYKIDVDELVKQFKEDDVYLIARIVVFKDKNLANYDKKQYSVWNSKTGTPWMGKKGTEEIKDENGNVTGTKVLYYDENWVDPYCEEVWEYNIEIAKELVERGFDEIQFDYIRFPTDGINMHEATYRWKDKGMDKESALVSFLSYARKNINAPIGIDIYGANGWYRSGTRTGQDVELMSDYVDVICPMFYPSHFEQNFLEYAPLAERPYRIYFYGSYRNTIMGRNKIIVRPWIQAFYMGVRYDRKFYDKNYVKREVFGVRDGLNRGYMYWNNSGGFYDDISPDPEENEMSPWRKDEVDLQTRVPAFSSGIKSQEMSEEELQEEIKNQEEMISLWNYVREKEFPEEKDEKSVPKYFLHVNPGLGK